MIRLAAFTSTMKLEAKTNKRKIAQFQCGSLRNLRWNQNVFRVVVKTPSTCRVWGGKSINWSSASAILFVNPIFDYQIGLLARIEKTNHFEASRDARVTTHVLIRKLRFVLVARGFNVANETETRCCRMISAFIFTTVSHVLVFASSSLHFSFVHQLRVTKPVSIQSSSCFNDDAKCRNISMNKLCRRLNE